MRERERGQEVVRELGNHLNMATSCNQMGGLMRRESRLNTTPRRRRGALRVLTGECVHVSCA